MILARFLNCPGPRTPQLYCRLPGNPSRSSHLLEGPRGSHEHLRDARHYANARGSRRGFQPNRGDMPQFITQVHLCTVFFKYTQDGKEKCGKPDRDIPGVLTKPKESEQVFPGVSLNLRLWVTRKRKGLAGKENRKSQRQRKSRRTGHVECVCVCVFACARVCVCARVFVCV